MSAKRTLKSLCIFLNTSLLKFVYRFFRFPPRYKRISALIVPVTAAAFISAFSVPVYSRHQTSFNREQAKIKNQKAPRAHLVEMIPKRYLNRYNRWKAMLLSVESGRRLWEKYAENPAFRLTVIISKSKNMGAEVNDHQWENGKLVGVTITLGSRLDYGFPSIINYPVLGALAAINAKWNLEGKDVLGAAKFAHELGHIDYAIHTDQAKYQLQNELSPIFAERFLSNGHNSSDPILLELMGQMGGSPLQIRQERENWAETYALQYLREKLDSKKLRSLLKWVRQSIKSKFAHYSPPLQAIWNKLISPAWESTASFRLE